jgi:hypothetical protein
MFWAPRRRQPLQEGEPEAKTGPGGSLGRAHSPPGHDQQARPLHRGDSRNAERARPSPPSTDTEPAHPALKSSWRSREDVRRASERLMRLEKQRSA